MCALLVEMLDFMSNSTLLTSCFKSVSFAFLASHDLQEPLNTIVSFSEILQSEEKLSMDGQEYLGIIKDSSSRLKGLINDLLAYSSIGRQSEAKSVG